MLTSHAHYDDRQFDKDRDELLKDIHKNGIKYIVNSGESLRASKAGVELGKKYDFIYSLQVYTQTTPKQ